MKKQVILGMASLMFAGMLSTGTASAAEPTAGTEVPVSYDNRNAITDPDNPIAEWSVSIPTSIGFKKDVTTADVGLELVPMNGAKLEDLATLSVNVKAKSTNGLVMKSGEESLQYTVAYGSNSLTGTTESQVATLTKDAATQAGTATLAADAKPTKIAIYTDTLTYTIVKGTVAP